MIQIRREEERGKTQLDWLDSRHSFSFDRYYDPRYMGFRSLRVINEDRVRPASGFPTHPHRDMEILTCVLEGTLEHKDSMGNGSLIRPGEVQRMTAGTGITHSEYNASQEEPVHLLQIWILPERLGLKPSYEQRSFPVEESGPAARLVAARDGRNGAVTIHQDVNLFFLRMRAGEQAVHELKPGRHAWLQVARGAMELNGAHLQAGDGAAISQETSLLLAASDKTPLTEALLFDLA